MTTARRLVPCLTALLAAAATASAAAADGGPIGGIDGGAGATAGTTPFRFVTFGAGRESTVIARVHKADGTIDGSRTIRGSYGIPAVAYDGTGGGVSVEADTVVLAEWPRTFPSHRLRLKVVDATSLRTQRTITLRGTWSFDALSPDGSKLYLVKYRSPTNLTSYAVRAYDVPQGRLLARPVVDKREPDERMRGLPITRTSANAGDWAYTLYDGGGDAPFIHALNTAQGAAYCIDLDELAVSQDLFNFRLRLNESKHRLAVVDPNRNAVLNVDTRTWKVTKPGAPHPAAPPPASAHDGGGPSAWLIALGAGALALLALVGTLLSRRRSAAPA